jgi:predicted metalloprotease with PDZ domain
VAQCLAVFSGLISLENDMSNRPFRPFLVPLFLMTITPAVLFADNPSAPAMTLLVDESHASQRLAFVHEEIQVRPGGLALAYPKWIPGEHGPTGPIQQFAKLRIRAGNTDLRWTRDPEEIFTIHVEVPAGVNAIDVDFDTLMENTISDRQLLVAWNTVVLYPRGIDKTRLMILPSLILPQSWKQASSLTVTSQSGERVNFAPVSLERLIDSPVLASEFLRVFQLSSSWPAELDVTGDSQTAVDKADDAHAVELYTKLVEQDRAMFGYRHWEKMHFLVSQSAAKPFDGLEHEDSPWDAVTDAGLSKKGELEKFGWPLLAHEQSHSWCGKYRRPAELYSKPDYQGPERTSLLWVYEGLNEYIGMLLATRSGFNDRDYMRDYFGFTTDNFGHEAARDAIPLVDTATEDWVLRSESGDWYDLRRAQDYYDEGALIWLRADTIIREQTHGQKSLDDFLRIFLGQRDTGPIVAPYTREDIEAALAAVLRYDWHNFFETRIYRVNPKPPIEGLEAAGWRLVYNDTPNKEYFFANLLPVGVSAQDSLGIVVLKDSSIFDVVSNSPAYNAGFAPHMTIIAVDGRVYSPDVLNEAIAHPHNGKITLVVRNFDSVETREISYGGGVKYPHLERIPETHDYLPEILQPRKAEQH